MKPCLRNQLLFFMIITVTIYGASLQTLCIRNILAHPREYIKRGMKVSKDIEKRISDTWHTAVIQLRFDVKQLEDLDIDSPDFLSRILLIEACNKIIYQSKKIILTDEEKEIFNSIPKAIQENMEPYVSKCHYLANESGSSDNSLS